MPTELTVATIGAGAVILAALISFIVAVSSAVIAKEQKVSEFRQAWINDIRIDFLEICCLSFDSIFNARLQQLNAQKIQSKNNSNLLSLQKKSDELSKEQNEIFSALERKTVLVKLKLNPNKDNEFINEINKSLKLIEQLIPEKYKVEDLIKFDSDICNIQKVLDGIENSSHKLLKTEWERVKKGELRYRFFIAAGEILIWASLTAFLVLVLSSNFPQYCPIAG